MNVSELVREAGCQEMGQGCTRGDGGLWRQTWLNLSGFSYAGRMGKQKQQVAEGGPMRTYAGWLASAGTWWGHQCWKGNRVPNCVPGQRPRRASQAKHNLEGQANTRVKAREWESSAMSQGWLRTTELGGKKAGKHFTSHVAQFSLYVLQKLKSSGWMTSPMPQGRVRTQIQLFPSKLNDPKLFQK